MIAELFTYMDVAIVVILMIAGIVGATKGFAKQFFSLISLAVIVLVAVLLCDKLAGVVAPVFGEPIQDAFTDIMMKNDTNGLFTSTNNWALATDEYQTQILGMLGIPSILAKIAVPAIGETVRGFGECALIEKLPPIVTEWAITVVCFIVIALLAAIVMLLIKKAVFKAIQNPGIGALNKFLGFVVSVVYSYALISIVLTVVTTLLSSLGFLAGVQEFIVEQAALSLEGKFPLFHYIYNYNFIGDWVMKNIIPKL